MITICLPGPVRGKGRPRSRIVKPKDPRKPAFVSVYTDAATRNYEGALAIVAKVAMRSKAPLEGPLWLKVIAYFDVPESWPRKKRDAALAGTIFPTGKPDWDNIAKMIDGLKGIVFQDDAQIVEAHIYKLYAESPSLQIEIRAVENFFGRPVNCAENGDNCPVLLSPAL